MAIIEELKGGPVEANMLGVYPDQFVSEAKKEGDKWVKTTMDYFANVAYAQFMRAKETFLRNYKLVKGDIDAKDFYIPGENGEVDTFVSDLTSDVALPEYVKNYSILGGPLNELVGELSNRPDASRVKAFDDESKSEELQFKTSIVQQYIIQEVKNRVLSQAGMTGQELSDDDAQQLTMEAVSEYLTDYTSIAEKWGNHVLEMAKMNFNMKEISEDAFRDQIITGREFIHIFEDNSKLGFGVKCENPKNVWVLTTPDKKLVEDSYANGTIHIMELSEIMELFPNIPTKEINFLREYANKAAGAILNPRESNYGKNVSGWDSIKYDTYSRLKEQERQLLEADMMSDGNRNDVGDFFGLNANVGGFGYKYVVIQAYFKGKKKIGKVTFLDEQGEEQTALVDENYEDSPNQIGKVEWVWVNQWYKGYKIGPSVYNIEEFRLLEGSPIKGLFFEVKNTDSPKSLIEQLKPYQIICNVAMNQAFSLMEKEIGNTGIMSLRHIPTPKDGDPQDAIEIWQMEAKKRGWVFVDDSPENTKGASGFNQFTNVDLTKSQEMATRLDIFDRARQMAYELIGVSRERLGSSAASATATAVNQSISASYSQTEQYFAQHENLMNSVYQGIIDAAQYIESQKPLSTLSYITTEGEQAFLQVQGTDLKLKDIQVFVTSRKKDQQAFQQLQQLAQPMLQNGATPYEISVMYTTDSIRELRRVMKKQADKQQQQIEAQQQMEQQQQQAQQQQFEYEQQATQNEQATQRQFEHAENELNRLNKIETTLIMAMATAKEDPTQYADSSADQKLQLDKSKYQSDNDLKMKQLQSQQESELAHLQLEYTKLQTEKLRIQADLKMSADDIKAKKQIAKSKPKPKAK